MNGASASMSSRSRSRKRRERDGRVKRLGYEELESLKHETEKLGQAMSETTKRELKTAKLLVKEKAKHAETKSDAFFWRTDGTAHQTTKSGYERCPHA